MKIPVFKKTGICDFFGAQKGDWTLTPCGIRVWDVRVYHSTTWAYCLYWSRSISTCTPLALLGGTALEYSFHSFRTARLPFHHLRTLIHRLDYSFFLHFASFTSSQSSYTWTIFFCISHMQVSPNLLVSLSELYVVLSGDTKLALYPLGTGLINDTWITNIQENNKRYVVQRLNTKVFPSYKSIENNLRLAKEILSGKDYLLFLPVENIHGELHTNIENEIYRVTEFCEGSQVYDAPPSTKHIYEAAKAFATFTRYLGWERVNDFQETIEGFHNLSKRFADFEKAWELCEDQERRSQAESLVNFALTNRWIVDLYVRSVKSIPKRIYHHDTKVNNILFKTWTTQVIAPIDLDTIMPWYIFSDLGDMIWSIAAWVDHSDLDLESITIDRPRYDAIMDGYRVGMADTLTSEEVALLPYAWLVMSYMLGLRFLADYLGGDSYFKVSHPWENLDRTTAQFQVVKFLIDGWFAPVC